MFIYLYVRHLTSSCKGGKMVRPAHACAFVHHVYIYIYISLQVILPEVSIKSYLRRSIKGRLSELFLAKFNRRDSVGHQAEGQRTHKKRYIHTNWLLIINLFA